MTAETPEKVMLDGKELEIDPDLQARYDRTWARYEDALKDIMDYLLAGGTNEARIQAFRQDFANLEVKLNKLEDEAMIQHYLKHPDCAEKLLERRRKRQEALEQRTAPKRRRRKKAAQKTDTSE